MVKVLSSCDVKMLVLDDASMQYVIRMRLAFTDAS